MTRREEESIFRFISDPQIITDLEFLKKNSTQVLRNDLLKGYTDHSDHHSCRVVENASRLISNAVQHFNDDMLSTLYAACWLHDYGMHVENLDDSTYVKTHRVKWRKLSRKEKYDFIRDHHHRLSAEHVMRLCREGKSKEVNVGQILYPGAVASLCAMHCLDVDGDEYKKLADGQKDINIRLLSAVLRLADILDENSDRALAVQRETRELSPESLKHWWRLYYTQVNIRPEKNRTDIFFSVPRNDNRDYELILKNLQLPYIEKEFRIHEDIFDANDMHFRINDDCLIAEYPDRDEMPQVIYDALKEEATPRILDKATRYLRAVSEMSEKEETFVETIPQIDYEEVFSAIDSQIIPIVRNIPVDLNMDEKWAFYVRELNKYLSDYQVSGVDQLVTSLCFGSLT